MAGLHHRDRWRISCRSEILACAASPGAYRSPFCDKMESSEKKREKGRKGDLELIFS